MKMALQRRSCLLFSLAWMEYVSSTWSKHSHGWPLRHQSPRMNLPCSWWASLATPSCSRTRTSQPPPITQRAERSYSKDAWFSVAARTYWVMKGRMWTCRRPKWKSVQSHSSRPTMMRRLGLHCWPTRSRSPNNCWHYKALQMSWADLGDDLFGKETNLLPHITVISCSSMQNSMWNDWMRCLREVDLMASMCSPKMIKEDQQVTTGSFGLQWALRHWIHSQPAWLGLLDLSVLVKGTVFESEEKPTPWPGKRSTLKCLNHKNTALHINFDCNLFRMAQLTKEDIVTWSSKIGWKAAPLRTQGAKQWIVGADCHPPTILTWNGQPLIAHEVQTKRYQEQIVVAGPRERKVHPRNQRPKYEEHRAETESLTTEASSRSSRSSIFRTGDPFLDPWASTPSTATRTPQALGTTPPDKRSEGSTSTRPLQGPVASQFQLQEQRIQALEQAMGEFQSEQKEQQQQTQQHIQHLDRQLQQQQADTKQGFAEVAQAHLQLTEAIRSQDGKIGTAFEELKTLFLANSNKRKNPRPFQEGPTDDSPSNMEDDAWVRHQCPIRIQQQKKATNSRYLVQISVLWLNLAVYRGDYD